MWNENDEKLSEAKKDVVQRTASNFVYRCV